jgi:hypothetical protein
MIIYKVKFYLRLFDSGFDILMWIQSDNHSNWIPFKPIKDQSQNFHQVDRTDGILKRHQVRLLLGLNGDRVAELKNQYQEKVRRVKTSNGQSVWEQFYPSH